MDKKQKFDGLMQGAGKTAKGLWDNAVQAADQNDDGKFDLADVSVIAGTMGNAMKKGTQAIKSSAEEKARLMELKTLQPIFAEDLESADFLLPKFIRVADRDKKYITSEVCQNSVGHYSEPKGLRMVNIFRDSITAFSLSFYPDSDSEFYYVDPSDRDAYIALDDYFSYLKVARINELQKIAQDLGAKHFSVTYKEEQTAFTEKKLKSQTKVSLVGSGDVDCVSTEKKYSTVEIAANTDMPGHAPVKPELKYLQRDPSIQNLIAMRMDESSPLLHQKLTLKLSNSSGIKESNAVKIDAALKGMKYSGNCTVANEAQNESRRYLEYDIDF